MRRVATPRKAKRAERKSGRVRTPSATSHVSPEQLAQIDAAVMNGVNKAITTIVPGKRADATSYESLLQGPLTAELPDSEAAKLRLEVVRARFDDLLKQHGDKLKKRVQAGYRRYRVMVDEYEKTKHERAERRLDKVRGLLESGLLKEADETNGPDWDREMIEGAFSAGLIRQVTDAKAKPFVKSIQKRLANACLEVLADRSFCRDARVSDKRKDEKHRTIKAKLDAGTHTTWTARVEFRCPLGLDEPIHPASFGWKELEARSKTDRLHLAFARLGSLHDVRSLSPIIARPQKLSRRASKDRVKEWQAYDCLTPAHAPAPMGGTQHGQSAPPPEYHPGKLLPTLAESLLCLIEGELSKSHVPSPPNGWMKESLMQVAGIGDTLFDEIRRAAKVPGRRRGEHSRPFDINAVMNIIKAAKSGEFTRKGEKAAKAWQKLVDNYHAPEALQEVIQTMRQTPEFDSASKKNRR